MNRTIGSFASRPVISVETEASVQDALRLMSEKRISCIVVTSHGEPIGILTERDIVFAANWLLGQPDLLVKEVMNKPVLTASEDMTIAQAVQVFSEHKIRHLVVLDVYLEMAGIFTQTDLVRSLKDQVFSGVSDLSSLMSPHVLHVDAEVPARYALSLMARRSVSCVVVMQDGKPAGIFTERDVVSYIAKGVDLSDVPVGSVMSPSIISTPVTSSPAESIGLMMKKSIRRLLVVDELGEMKGILTQTDLGRVFELSEGGVVERLLSGAGTAQGAMS